MQNIMIIISTFYDNNSYRTDVPLSNPAYEAMSGVYKVENETDAKGKKVYENDIMEKPMHSAGYNIYAQIYEND